MTRKLKRRVRAAWLELHEAWVIVHRERESSKEGTDEVRRLNAQLRALSIALEAVQEIEDESGVSVALT